MDDDHKGHFMSLTGFMFGNIDESGRLEDDFLDEESKDRLTCLSSMGITSCIDQDTFADTTVNLDEENDIQPIDNKSENAIDFSDINELAEDDIFIDSTAKLESKFNNEDISPIKKLNTPLAALLPPELADADVKEMFPEFRPGQVLRFSRLFKPAHVPHMWKRKKKKIDSYDGNNEQELNQNMENQYMNHQQQQEKQFVSSLKLDMGRAPLPEEIMIDDRTLLIKPLNETGSNDENRDGAQRPLIAPWRYGPARLWYDMLKVPSNGEGFDYGFKLKQKMIDDINNQKDKSMEAQMKISEDAFHMITQLHWEDDVIWNAEDAKNKMQNNSKMRAAAAGWIPSLTTRTLHQYLQQNDPQYKYDPNASIFPIENQQLIHGRWEDDVIWDAEAMHRIPEPPVLILDPDDEDLILEIPDDDYEQPTRQPTDSQDSNIGGKKEKELRKSKLLLGKNISSKEDEENENENILRSKDPFNMSNDEYYNPRLMSDGSMGRSLNGSVIQHATPAIELCQLLFPCHMSTLKLRNFHRPPLKKYSRGLMSTPGPHSVFSLLKQIKRKEKLREQERMASGGGEMFFMRAMEDLSAKDGDLILAEYSEQYPSLVNRIGMATKIKNYYKRKPGKEINQPEFVYGELAYAHTSPFLGSLQPGQSLSAFENNMFRAPIYEHKFPNTDFLIIRNRNHFYIRDINTIFAVGQECPLIEVPGPNSKRANNFLRDFLQVYIQRLFWKSTDNPRRIKMEEVRRSFPTHSESSIRKRLKICSDFKRTGNGLDSNWWVLKSNVRLPTEEEMREMISPEQCCSFYSMLAAEQRLKDAGYGEKSLFAAEEDNDEDMQTKIEDEVKAAPWNTTRAYISAMKGRCLLALNGVADPTGCGEAFSYIKVPNKPQQGKDDAQNPGYVKRSVTGTDADLRKLALKDAKQLLRKFGLGEAEIKSLSRWEVIDVVRTMSTEQAKKAQDEAGGVSKFARGNKFSLMEHHEKYREECQRIFDLQNRILSSIEILSSDDELSSGEDSDFETMGRNIENMLANKKVAMKARYEKEEADRIELQKMMSKQPQIIKGKKKDTTMTTTAMMPTTLSQSSQNSMRKLIITRTYKGEDGHEFTRTEVVKKSPVIDAYLRIRKTNDKTVMQQFSLLDENAKEEMKKEKRRIQDQLRRLKKNHDKNNSMDDSYFSTSSFLNNKFSHKQGSTNKFQRLMKGHTIKCGACGKVGHTKSNRECPMFGKALTAPLGMPGNVAMTIELEEELGRSDLVEDQLVNIEGTKVTIPRQIVERAEDIQRKSLVLKLPKLVNEVKKKRRISTTTQHIDYLRKCSKQVQRKRSDPVVTLSTLLESILNEMRELSTSTQFLFPVNAKQVVDYYDIIETPMDLQTLREKLRDRKYLSREAFVIDVYQIVRNCEIYNGPKHSLTAAAQKLFDFCLQKIAEKEDRLIKLEKAINPLLDDDDMVSLSFIFTSIIEEKLKTIEGSIQFHMPVSRKQYKDYYNVIQNPIDLSTIQKKASDHQYFTRDEFLSDVELLAANCQQFNGSLNPLTGTALKIIDACRLALLEHADALAPLECRIQQVRQAALDDAENESVVTGTSFTGDGADLFDVIKMDSSSIYVTSPHDGDDVNFEDDDDDDDVDFKRRQKEFDEENMSIIKSPALSSIGGASDVDQPQTATTTATTDVRSFLAAYDPNVDDSRQADDASGGEDEGEGDDTFDPQAFFNSLAQNDLSTAAGGGEVNASNDTMTYADMLTDDYDYVAKEQNFASERGYGEEGEGEIVLNGLEGGMGGSSEGVLTGDLELSSDESDDGDFNMNEFLS